MAPKTKESTKDVIKAITSERKRTNILRKVEENSIAYLVQRIPSWISSNILTGIGVSGNIIVAISLVLAKYQDKYFLLLGVLGFFISWFGDSLDGRIAYYRKIPRKWYGFALDIVVDWVGIAFIGVGFMIYLGDPWLYVGYAFIILYSMAAIISLLRYKIIGKYSIDSGFFGPTEIRIFISLILLIEIFVSGALNYFGLLAVILISILNIKDANQLLDKADERDLSEKK